MFFHSYQKKQDKQPEIVPEEAAIVERIYEMFLAGQPVKVIAQTLQAEKIEIPGKNLSFSKNMIMNILRNEKILRRLHPPENRYGRLHLQNAKSKSGRSTHVHCREQSSGDYQP